MEKYRKVPRSRAIIKEDEIRVTSLGRLPNYISYAAKVFHDQNKTSVIIKATGNAIARAVTLAEILKRRIHGLHQLTRCGSTTLTDVYEPIEEGLDKVTHERTVSYIEITLNKVENELNKNDPGYQPPLDEALVRPLSPEEMTRMRGGGGGRPRGGRPRNTGFYPGWRGYGRGRYSASGPAGPPRGERRGGRGGRDGRDSARDRDAGYSEGFRGQERNTPYQRRV